MHNDDEIDVNREEENPFEGKVFESYIDMVNFIANHANKLPKKEGKRLGKILFEKTSYGSDASTVMKEIRKLKVSEASANAERDAALALLDEVDAKLEDIYSQHTREVKILSHKLTEIKGTDTDIITLVAGLEKRTAALKEVRQKLSTISKTSKTALAVKEKEIKKKVASVAKELKEVHAKDLVETYVGMKLSHSGLKIQENSRALLEKCVSTKEVDEVFESIKDAMRVDALRPGEITEIKITPAQKKDIKVKTQRSVTESVHNAMDGM